MKNHKERFWKTRFLHIPFFFSAAIILFYIFLLKLTCTIMLFVTLLSFLLLEIFKL